VLKTIMQWLLAATCLLALNIQLSAQTTGSNLATEYTISASGANVTWAVCGSTQQTSGCYGSGFLGPFGKAGALLEGNPSTNLTTNTATRSIYILDVASGPNRNAVKLYVYRKSDTVTSTSDSVSVVLGRTVNLPITGGASAVTYMAGNNNFLFIGTDQSPFVLKVQKGTFAITEVSGPYSGNVSSITTDKYGHVEVMFGGGLASANHVTFNSDGARLEGGSGGSFLLNTTQAVLP